MDRQASDDGPDLTNRNPTGGVWLQARSLARAKADLLVILGFYALAVALIPTMADVAVADDWIFSWSATRFAATGVIDILPISGPNAVFEALLGGIVGFGSVPSLGALRLSTVTLTGISAAALWKMLEAKPLKPSMRGVVVAGYLFNPLTMSLSFSFMTDAHSLALTVISIALYDRGMRGGRSALYLGLGSSTAALAFLSRPQALVVVVAVLAAGLFRRTRFTLGQAFASTLLPFLVVAGNFVWRGGTSPMQMHFVETLFTAGTGEHSLNLVLTAAGTVGFVGLFAAPLLAGIWHTPDVRSLAMAFIAPAFLVVMAFRGPFPFVDDWIGADGVGVGPYFFYLSPNRSDPANWSWFAVVWPTVVSAGVLLLGALYFDKVVRMFKVRPLDETTVFAGVGFAMALGGIVASSVWFSGSPPNRYFLALLPWVLIQVLPVVSRMDHRPMAGWVVVVFLAVASVVGVHDSIEAEEAVWGLAQRAVDSGVPLDQLSASAAWDGHHFGPDTAASGTYGLDFQGKLTWWLVFYAPQIEPEYLIVLSEPPSGYEIVFVRDYKRWGFGQGRAFLVRAPHPLAHSGHVTAQPLGG